MKSRYGTFGIAATAAVALLCASSAFAAGTATVRVTNAGTVPLSVSGADVRPGASATRTVPAERAGRLPVSAPAGWTINGSADYPALRPGAAFSVRLSAVRDMLAPVPEVESRPAPAPKAVPPPREAPDPSLPPAVPAPAVAAPTVPAARPRTPPRTVPAARAADGADGERAFEIPMLWVRHGPVVTGGLSRNPFSFRRSGSGRLLRVSASEDTPGGSGGMMRASLWLAAATAAMFRNDPMDGVKMEVEYTGHVDGPSAGGVTCLAILCALDGIPFPDDFAMTGTILADGTIGLVGGVAHKLEGAAAAGAKRVCIPSFCRFEEQEDGDFVDLWEKAEELGLELHPVSSVEEAWAVLRGRGPEPRPTVPDAEAYRDAPGVDKALFETMAPRIAECIRWETRYEEGDMPGEAAETAFGILEPFGNGSASFDVAFMAGLPHVLSEQVADRLAWWRTVGKLSELIPELDGRYDEGSFSGLVDWKRDLSDRFGKLGGAIGAAEARWTADAAAGRGASALAGQCVEVNFFSQCKTVLGRAERNTPAIGPGDVAAENERYEGHLSGLVLQEALCRLFEARFRLVDENARAVAAALPRRDAGPAAERAEKFFHAAQAALRNSLEAEHGRGAILSLGEENYDWELYLLKCGEAEEYHATAAKLRGERSPGAGFATVVSAMAQADALAHGCMAATMAGNEIGAKRDEDGDLVWKNHPFLSFLLRTARERAIAALAECDRAGVPCPRVRAHLQNADYHRDDAAFDRFDVVREYWCATLKAKALLMMFAPSSAASRR